MTAIAIVREKENGNTMEVLASPMLIIFIIWQSGTLSHPVAGKLHQHPAHLRVPADVPVAEAWAGCSCCRSCLSRWHCRWGSYLHHHELSPGGGMLASVVWLIMPVVLCLASFIRWKMAFNGAAMVFQYHSAKWYIIAVKS